MNNGVYRSKFATRADAYEQAVSQLFASLDSLESRLTGKRYLLGNTLTEADWRLFTTLVRFDAVYFGHFKYAVGVLPIIPHSLASAVNSTRCRASPF